MKQPLKTIILEDDLMARMILENFCENHPDIELKADFDDIEEAIQYLDKHEVDLVFLDIQLKNSNGFDLLSHMKSSTQVIITTGDTDIIPKAAKYGINNTLIKPITLEQFLWSVKMTEESGNLN
ncbi:MAG: LytR/AlgR family response regulator transcription factor [Chitinophagaceae bacterium]|jgi:response regulator of citrate/malate metabolism